MTLGSNTADETNIIGENTSPENIAAMALQYLADDPELLSRFLALTGIDPSQLREASGQPGFPVGVLDFFLNFEPSLMKFAEANNLDPKTVVSARAILDNNGTAID